MDSEETSNIDDKLPVPKSTLQILKEIDEQLAFLVLLTVIGIKPMSRWEKPLVSEQIELLSQCGLHWGQIHRTTLNGTEVVETLFSRSQGYIEIYRNRWDGMGIDKSPQAVRFEGYLFGYPPCCVEAYIHKPYAPNDIDPEQQKRLFHWACKNCKITPFLLPIYQRTAMLLKSTDTL